MDFKKKLLLDQKCDNDLLQLRKKKISVCQNRNSQFMSDISSLQMVDAIADNAEKRVLQQKKSSLCFRRTAVKEAKLNTTFPCCRKRRNKN